MDIFAASYSGVSSQNNLKGQASFFSAPEKSSAFKTVLQEVREKGLADYAQEKRLEELKEKILDKLGVTEEKLQSMTPEQRVELFNRVQEEIQKILMAERELNKKEDEWNALKDYQLNSPLILNGLELNNTMTAKPSVDLFAFFSDLEKVEEKKAVD